LEYEPLVSEYGVFTSPSAPTPEMAAELELDVVANVNVVLPICGKLFLFYELLDCEGPDGFCPHYNEYDCLDQALTPPEETTIRIEATNNGKEADDRAVLMSLFGQLQRIARGELVYHPALKSFVPPSCDDTECVVCLERAPITTKRFWTSLLCQTCKNVVCDVCAPHLQAFANAQRPTCPMCRSPY